MYHAEYPGLKFKSSGSTRALEVEAVELAWDLDAIAVRDAAAAYARHTGKRVFCWGPSSSRVFALEHKLTGAVAYEYTDRGDWQRETLEARCAFPGCPVETTRSRKACADHHAQACVSFKQLDDESGLSPIGLRRLADMRVAIASGERLDDELVAFIEAKKAGNFIVQPKSAFDVHKGDTVSFSASCARAMRYEWYQNNGRSRHDICRDVLLVRGAASADTGTYWCRALVDGTWRRSASARLELDAECAAREVSKQSFDFATADEVACRSVLELDIDDDAFTGRVLARLATIAWERADRIKALYFASDAATRGAREVHWVHAQAAASLGFNEEALRALDSADLKTPATDQADRAARINLRATIEQRLRDPPRKDGHPLRSYSSQRAADLKTLGFKPADHLPPLKLLRRQYLNLVLQLHPDKGGNHSDFVRVQAAYERLRAT